MHHGAGDYIVIHPLFRVMERLFSSVDLNDARQALPPASVTISIPKTHPAAKKIMDAAAKLAAVTQLQGGIVLQKHVPPHYAEEELLKVLREELGGEVVDHAIQQVAFQQRENEQRLKILAWSRSMHNHDVQGKLVIEAAKLGVLQRQIAEDGGDMTRFLNKADAQRRGKGKIMDSGSTAL